LLLAFGSGAADATEQQVFGVPDRERGKWLDETVPLIRQLWSGEAVDHEGPRFTFSGLSLRPKPKQKRIDIWLGGRGPYALRRIGRLADGWLPSFCSPEEAAKGRALIEQSASEAGRTIDPEHFGANLQYSRKPLSDRTVQALRARRPEVDLAALVPVGQPALRDSVHRFVEAGCSKFVVDRGARVAGRGRPTADDLTLRDGLRRHPVGQPSQHLAVAQYLALEAFAGAAPARQHLAA
jgi:probable F420-dependent oxidoreductase